jgi:hypothetical protein
MKKKKRRRWSTDFTDCTDEEKKGKQGEATRQKRM